MISKIVPGEPRRRSVYTFTRRTLALAVIGTLGACGGGGGGAADTTAAPRSISGSVGDGPVAQAQISAISADSRVVGTDESGSDARFRIELAGDTSFPVMLMATGGTDLVTGTDPDLTMVAVAGKNDDTAHITPFSTLATRIAEGMPGGLTTANVKAAMNRVASRLNYGLDTTRIADPINGKLNEAAMTNMVKASEALAESIRRTRQALQVIGVDFSMDELIDIMASDMVDGALDGVGSNANTRVAAAANVVAASVLLESLNNELCVSNAVATDRIDAAIRAVQPNGSLTSADAGVPQAMLDQTVAALEAIIAFAPSDDLSALLTSVQQLQQTRTPTTRLVPTYSANMFLRILEDVVTASENRLETINAVIRRYAGDDGATPPDPGDGGSTPDDPGDPGDPGDGGSIGGTTTPMAFPDAAETEAGVPVTINVLANDRGLDDAPITVSLPGTPSHGTAKANNNNTVTYTPTADYAGQDNFTYTVRDVDGDSSMASVSITVRGVAPADRTVTLNWQPSTGTVGGYYVYFGGSTGAVNQRLSDLPVGYSQFNAESPSVAYSARDDLELGAGDQACFKVTAYNNVGESVPSSTVCADL